MTTTSELVNQLRAWGMTQAEIQNRTGISQSKLSRWGAGEAPSGADAALKLSALVETIRRERESQVQQPA